MPKNHSNRYTITFVVIICFICAIVLSVLSILLRGPQQEAEELYNSQQLLICARMLSHDGYFTTLDKGKFVRARLRNGVLTPDPEADKARASEILDLFSRRIETRLVNPEGDLVTFEEAGIDETLYLTDNQKMGYAHLPNKLIYVIKGLPGETLPYGYVIPVNGFGLWDAIYGYICVGPNANMIIGTAWYDQKETPGLGAAISTAEWQDQFYGKEIFEGDNFATSPIGIDVVKGKAYEKHEVDGIPGATVTTTAVEEAYRQSLAPYRLFLLKAHKRYLEGKGSENDR